MTRAAQREQVHDRSLVLGLLSGLTAAVSYGAANVITRQNLDDVPPIVASMVALITGTLGFILLSARGLRAPAFNLRKGVAYFALAGVFSTAGVLAQFLALERAPVVLVSPVANTNPLFALLFVALFLRRLERLTPGVFLGAGLVVAGVAVLTLG